MLYAQVNKLFAKINLVRRLFSVSNYKCYSAALINLRHRTLLKVSGEDAPEFLQGLVTNDMRHFDDGQQVMYALFLNNKGRVLYDSIIYNWGGKNTFLIECERSVFSLLSRHLNLFKLRRQVEFEDANVNLNLWALLRAKDTDLPDFDIKFDPKGLLNLFKDPRLPELGCRIVTSNLMSAEQIVDLFGSDFKVRDNELYKYVRYKLGVPEGPDELPPGACFPLESNADYLHGVSFHKGCYIGQELTARIHHTGIVRKRVMPLRFLEQVNCFLNKDDAITCGTDKAAKIGKLKGYIHDYGLGLLRVKDALEASVVKVKNYSAEAIKPAWWPLEAPKEKLKIKPE